MDDMSAFPQILYTLQRYGINTLSDLKQGAAEQNDFPGIFFVINTGNQKTVFLLTMPTCYKFLNQGRRPGRMPPVEKIRQWLTTHLNTHEKPTGLRLQNSHSLKMNNNNNWSLRAAFAIAKSISINGVRPKHFLSNTFKTGGAGDINKLIMELTEALKIDAANQLKINN